MKLIDKIELFKQNGITNVCLVPVLINKRCFVPCDYGYCNCIGTDDTPYHALISLENQKQKWIETMDDCKTLLEYLIEKNKKSV